MKRLFILFMALGLITGSVATAEAGRTRPKRVQRTVEGSYKTPVLPFDSDRCSQLDGQGCVAIRTGARESFFTAKATDAHGLPVLVQVWTSTDHDGIEDVHFGTFCGETTRPISFPPGTELHFWVGFTYSFAPYESCPGGTVATAGAVSVTLSNLP